MNPIFSTELANELNESKYMEAGIHENVKFVNAEKFISPNGNAAIRFNFEKDGKEFQHTEWAPKKFNDDDDKAFQERTTRLVQRIAGRKGENGLMSAFYTPDELNFEGSSFSEFITWVIEKLNATDKDQLYRVKIVYNKNGFTTFPNKIFPPFIQKMSDAVITVIPTDKDLMIRPIRPDKEVEDKDDSMPF